MTLLPPSQLLLLHTIYLHRYISLSQLHILLGHNSASSIYDGIKKLRERRLVIADARYAPRYYAVSHRSTTILAQHYGDSHSYAKVRRQEANTEAFKLRQLSLAQFHCDVATFIQSTPAKLEYATHTALIDRHEQRFTPDAYFDIIEPNLDRRGYIVQSVEALHEKAIIYAVRNAIAFYGFLEREYEHALHSLSILLVYGSAVEKSVLKRAIKRVDLDEIRVYFVDAKQIQQAGFSAHVLQKVPAARY
jgi:hypothetical protein